jgi:hypothetical protein
MVAESLFFDFLRTIVNEISTTSGMGTNRRKKYKIENLPVREATLEVEQQMERLVDYLLWQKKCPTSPKSLGNAGIGFSTNVGLLRSRFWRNQTL